MGRGQLSIHTYIYKYTYNTRPYSIFAMHKTASETLIIRKTRLFHKCQKRSFLQILQRVNFRKIFKILPISFSIFGFVQAVFFSFIRKCDMVLELIKEFASLFVATQTKL